MFLRTRANNLLEQEYKDFQEYDTELKHLNHLDLTDSEIEFLQMKRSRHKRAFVPAPDPRLGEYET